MHTQLLFKNVNRLEHNQLFKYQKSKSDNVIK